MTQGAHEGDNAKQLKVIKDYQGSPLTAAGTLQASHHPSAVVPN